MGITAMAAMGAGAASNVVGTYFSAKQQKANLEYEASISEANARLAENAAQTELRRGEREMQGSRLKTAALKSSQRASIAANGIDLASGTAQNILNTTDVMGEVDALTIESNAIASAWGYRTQSSNFRSDAIVRRGAAAGISPGMAAAGSLLTNAGQVAGNWYMLNKAGAFETKNKGVVTRGAAQVGPG